MKKYKRILSIFLTLVMVLTAHTSVYATSDNQNLDTQVLHEEGVYIIEPEDVIDALSLEELESQKCIERMPNLEEDLHSVVYECADGNFAAYIFQYPIKYINSTGEIKDISTSIKSSANMGIAGNLQNSALAQLKNEYAYVSEENSIKVFYSDDLSSTTSAIVATNSDWSVGLAPYVSPTNSSSISAALYTENDFKISPQNASINATFRGIEYEGVFNHDVSLHYQTTYTGYKEVIKIKSPINQNTFQFVLTTGGLLPEVAESGEILLIDPSNNQTVASFAPLYVYDSSSVPLYTLENSYQIEPMQANAGQYLVTIEIDAEFLADANTTYPVMIDPTFSYNTSSAIDDAPVYTGAPASAQGANYYNHVGYVDSTYGTGSLLVKFPALKSSSLFNGLSDSKINSVTYNVRKVGGSNSYTATLRAYRYTGPSWNESTVTYNSAAIESNTGSQVASVSMSTNAWYSFNITSEAKAWKNGTASYDSGLVIKNATNTTNNLYDRTLASVEYGGSIDSTAMPYVTVIYNNGGTSGGFKTASLAAREFAISVYSSSEYSRIEYAATIYLLNGNYYYYNVHSGEPHSVGVSKSVPSGATYVAYIHTHPNSENFSTADINAAENLGGSAYVVTPSYSLKQYNSSTNSTTTPYTNLTISQLTSAEKSTLKSSLSSTWYGHLVNGVCPSNFGCENKTWPNE